MQRIAELQTFWKSHQPLSVELNAALMQRFRMDWNYHSNSIEGNSLSYGETKALLLYGVTAGSKPLRDHIEMSGHNQALKMILDIVSEDRPLTEAFIRQIHQLVLKESYEIAAITPEGLPCTKTIRVGEYKSTPNHVQTTTGEIFRFATPEATPSLMMDLIAWYRARKADKTYNVVLLAAEFHYKFIRIHPFDDGNGRTARILMNFILMSNNYPPVIIKVDDKRAYLAALRQADGGRFEPFYDFISNSLLASLELIKEVIEKQSLGVAEDGTIDVVDTSFIQGDLMVKEGFALYEALTIKSLKKKLEITDNDIAAWLQYKNDKAYRQSSAKPRIENFMLELYKKIKSAG